MEVRQPAVLLALMSLQMFDYASRCDHRMAVREQQRKQSERRVQLELVEILRMLLVEHRVFELRPVGPQGDQDFLAVAAERVREELQAHASSFAHVSRRFSSASLGGLVSNEPSGTSPAGS